MGQQSLDQSNQQPLRIKNAQLPQTDRTSIVSRTSTTNLNSKKTRKATATASKENSQAEGVGAMARVFKVIQSGSDLTLSKEFAHNLLTRQSTKTNLASRHFTP
mmetsp:Transcript_28039/g.37442  ORF Transcript_28039/g.37442 Transcript_28039/m.37442 type:complete len:104 (+) Transcript_28039:253-564(+)